MKISQLIKLARAVHHLRRIKMAATPSRPKNTYPAVPNVPKGTSPALSMAAKGRTFDEGGSSYDARVARAAGMKPGSPEYNSYMQNAQNARYATGAQAEMRAMGGLAAPSPASPRYTGSSYRPNTTLQDIGYEDMVKSYMDRAPAYHSIEDYYRPDPTLQDFEY